MVTTSHLAIANTSFVSSILTSVTMKLDDFGYLHWHFHMQLLLEGYGIVSLWIVDDSTPYPKRFLDINSGDFEVNSEGSFTRCESDGFKI